MEARYKNFNRCRFAATGIFICYSIVTLALFIVRRENLNGWLGAVVIWFFLFLAGLFCWAVAIHGIYSFIVKVDETGLYRGRWKGKWAFFMSWDDLHEWGIVEKKAKKYIYFSKNALSDWEKNRIPCFRVPHSSLNAWDTIVVEYDQKFYDYITALRTKKAQGLDVRSNGETKNAEMKVWMDFQGMIVGSHLICFFLALAIWGFAVKNLLAGIGLLFFAASVFFTEDNIIDMAGTLRLDGEGIVCKCWRREEKRWKWEEVYECGIVWGVRGVGAGSYPDMIYFSKKAVEDRVKNSRFFKYQFSKYEYEGDTLIVVRYSEKLNRYLRETGRLKGNSREKE